MEYGTRVEYTLTDGTPVQGKIIVPADGSTGSAHGIELDSDDPLTDELHWIGMEFVQIL